MEKLSKSHEDYLEAMVMLGGSPTNSIRSVDIAKELGVSKASVNKAISILKDHGLVVQPYYGDVSLTPEGMEYGAHVLDRHNLLMAFMTNVLGIDEKTAREEACLMEHAISDESYEKWAKYINALGSVVLADAPRKGQLDSSFMNIIP